MRVTPHEFLNRWFEHVPPRGLRMIRHSGLYANCIAALRATICQQLSQTDDAAEPQRAASAISRLDPEQCPLCNTEVVTQFVYRPLPTVFPGPQPPAALTRPP